MEDADSIAGSARESVEALPGVEERAPAAEPPEQALLAVPPDAVPALFGQSGQLSRWISIARAPVLLCSVAPVLVGAALLWSRGLPVVPWLLLATLAAAVLVQAAANVLDAYLDHVRAQRLTRLDPASSTARDYSRSLSALLEADIYPRDALRVAAALFGGGALLSIPLLIVGGWPVFALGVAGALVAVLYSSTSYALKRLLLGEVAVFLGLGPGLIALTLFVQRQPVTPLALGFGAGLGLFALALVEAANLRAVAPEIRDGRLTMVRLLGPWRGRLFFVACLLGAYALVIGYALPRGAPHGALAVLCSLPVSMLPLTGALRARGAAAFMPVVHATVRAYAYFAFWLLAGLVLGGLYLRLLTVLRA
jgi:1,4-dihydroxy-2-naphthoate polyprenyltransferase